MFQECAAFNPHLILGRNIFGGHIETKRGSIAEEVCSKISNMEFCYGEWYSTFTNWVTKEEAELLLMDFSNVSPRKEYSDRYYEDFKIFLEIAVKNSLGFIAGQNLRKSILKLIENPQISIDIDIKKLNLQSVIEYK